MFGVGFGSGVVAAEVVEGDNCRVLIVFALDNDVAQPPQRCSRWVREAVLIVDEGGGEGHSLEWKQPTLEISSARRLQGLHGTWSFRINFDATRYLPWSSRHSLRPVLAISCLLRSGRESQSFRMSQSLLSTKFEAIL